MRQLKNLHSIFNEYDVRFAVVYGSVYRNEDTEKSDVDIAVYLSGNPDSQDYMDRYISLIDKANTVSSRPVDITDIRTCRESFATRIAKNSRVIYDPEDIATDMLDDIDKGYPSKEEFKSQTKELRDRINNNL